VIDMIRIASESEARNGVPLVMIEKKDPHVLLADYIHKRLALVTRAKKGHQTHDRQIGENIAVIPILER